MRWMLMPLRRYADFQGRSRRKEFWLWQLFNLIIGGILATVLMILMFTAMARSAITSDYDRSDSVGSGGYEDSRGSGANESGRYDDEGTTEEGDTGGKPPADETSSRDGAAAPNGYLASSYSGGYRASSSSARIDQEQFAREFGVGGIIISIIVLIYSLAVFIPNLAVTIRRLHDTDRSGWMILLGLIPFVGPIILLVFYVSEGTRGPNRFGPDPKGSAYPGAYR